MVIVMPGMLAVICVLEVAVGVIGRLVSLMASMAVPVLVMLMGVMRMHLVLGLRFVHRLLIPFVLIHDRSS